MQRDTCDTLLTNASAGAPALTDRQRRFLEAYAERPVVARAAWLAGVHRSTFYRWRADPGFSAALKTAVEAFFQNRRWSELAAEAN